MILLLVPTMTICLVGEGYFRYRFRAWPFEVPLKVYPYLSENDSELRWRLSPDGDLNSLGLRNREIAAKPDGTSRILFLGDSLIFSGETSTGELYTQTIENNLNANSIGDSQNTEVINAGVPGYTTYQELEFLKKYGLDMKPDVVVLGFVFNDLYYKYLHKPSEDKFLSPDPEIKLHRFDTTRFPSRLFAKSYLAHETVYAVERARSIGSEKKFPFERKDDFYLAWKDYGWEEPRRLIVEMRQLLAEKHISLMVVIFPIADQLDDKYLNIDRDYVLYPQKRIKSICTDNSIPFLDLTPALYKGGGPAISRDGIHYNGKGNDIVAAEVTSFLKQAQAASDKPQN